MFVNIFSLAIHRWAGSDYLFMSWTKALQFNRQAEGQGPLRQAIMYDYNTNISEEVKLLSHVCLFVIPWTVAYQVPPSMECFQARVLEWVTIPFSRPGDGTQVFNIAGRCFTSWVTREAQHQQKASQRKWFQCRVRLGSSVQSRIKIKSVSFFLSFF